jgi:hypothetical protein
VREESPGGLEASHFWLGKNTHSRAQISNAGRSDRSGATTCIYPFVVDLDDRGGCGF